MSAGERAPVPDHVPAGLVHDFEWITDASILQDPFAVWHAMHERPEIFWATGLGGHWVVTRADAIRELMSNPADFSNNPAGIGEKRFPLLMIPHETDPPVLQQYRNVVAKIMAPGAIRERTAQIESVLTALIDRIAAKGECEFVKAIAEPFPTTIFTALMGLPLEESEKFLRWNHTLLHQQDVHLAQAGGMEIMSYLNGLIAQRRQAPQNDLVTALTQGTIDGRPLTHEEILGYAFLLFIAGLDTVAGTLSYIAAHLAQHPDDQARLRADPSLVPTALEEFLRRYSVVVGNRRCTRDVEFRGVRMKKGDFVMASTPIANLDPQAYECPMSVRLDRNPNPHMAFGHGPHRCLGSHLARAELTAFLRVFLQRIPPFRLKAGAVLRSHTGVLGIDEIPLVWN